MLKRIIHITSILLLAMTVNAQRASNWLRWSDGPKLPVAVSSAFAGMSGEGLIVAGGSNFPAPKWEGGQKTYYRAIYALTNGASGTWVKAGMLPRPLADGAALETPDGLLCLGGTDGQTTVADVFLLTWDNARKQVSIRTDYPSLPQPISHLSACRVGNTVYVVGGQSVMNQPAEVAYQLDLANRAGGWQPLPALPGPARFGAGLVAQSNGQNNALYVLGGKGAGGAFLRDAYALDLKANAEPAPADRSGRWKRLADLPRPAFLAPHAAVGPAHILLFSGSDGHDMDKAATARGLQDYQFVTDVLAYHTITNTWTSAGPMPLGLVGSRAVLRNSQLWLPGGEISPGVRTDRVQVATLPSQKASAGTFGWLDYGSLAGYFALITAISLWFSRQKKSADQFLRGGQNVPFWAVGISVMATQVSAIGFMTFPAKTFATNWAYFAGVATWFIVVPIVNWAFIPFYRKLNLTSAYQYLEARFDSRVRLLAAFVFVLFQLARMGLVLYLPALALSSVVPIDVFTSILLMGLLSTLYTALGGIEAVIWIEVAQAILLFGGAILCIVLAISGLEGGVSQFWQVATTNQKFSLSQELWDWTGPSLGVILLGNIFNRLGNLSSDQAIVQRFMTTPDLASARRSVWADVAASIPWAVVIFTLGTALFVFYQQSPQQLALTAPTDSILPHFIATQAPAGVCGLIIAAIFAASMSTLESSIHSVATICLTDFWVKRHPNLSDTQRLRFVKGAVWLLGVFATALSVVLLYADIRSLLDFFQELLGLFAGASMGLFFLGIFSRRANATGAIAGVVVSSAVMAYVTFFTPLTFWLFSVLGFLTCYGVGVLVSRFTTGRSQPEGLTIFSTNTPVSPTREGIQSLSDTTI